MIERRISLPPIMRPGATAVRRRLPTFGLAVSSPGFPGMNFVTLENIVAIAAFPAPIAAYSSGQLFESVSG